MWFGIRILSPFHLGTIQIPIQNQKCPKNAKNACADMTMLPSGSVFSDPFQVLSTLERCCFFSFSFSIIAIFHNIFQALSWTKMYVTFSSKVCPGSAYIKIFATEMSYFMTAWGGVMSAHGFLVFLGHFWFWMGICIVPRWNGLKILILRHMWKT